MEMIELTKIDEYAIQATNIRHLTNTLKDTESKKSSDLVESIKKFGQIYPIILRKLTDEEKEFAKEGAEFGVLDGHLRFEAITTLGLKTTTKYKSIKAEIIESKEKNKETIEENEEEKRERLEREKIEKEAIEKKIAMITNNARKEMQELEKAKTVYDLKNLEGKSYKQIGEELNMSKAYAGHLGLMWENHLEEQRRIESGLPATTKQSVQKEIFNLKMTKDLSKVIQERITNLKTQNAEEKIVTKANAQALIAQLQALCTNINADAKVKEIMDNDKVIALTKKRAETLTTKIANLEETLKTSTDEAEQVKINGNITKTKESLEKAIAKLEELTPTVSTTDENWNIV